MAAGQKFVVANSEQINWNTTIPTISSYPYTLACWVKPTVGGQLSGFVGYLKVPASNFNTFLGGSASNFYAYVDNGGLAGAVGSTVYTQGVWYHLAGVFVSDTLREIWVNGVLDGTNTTTKTIPAGLTSLVVGARKSSANYSDCTMSDVYLFDKRLVSGEINELMNNPNSMPNDRVFYEPLRVDASAASDFINQVDGVAASASVLPTASSDGPPVTFPQMLTT